MAVLAIDIDDVLIPFYASMADWHNEQYGTDYTIDQLSSNKLSSGWKQPEQYWIDKCNEFHSSGLSAQVPVEEDARAALESLVEMGHEIVLVTSRPSMHREQTERWMRENLSHVTDTLVMCDDYSDTGGTFHMDKGEIAKSLNAKLLVDDAPHYAHSTNEAGLLGILFGDYSWNREHDYELSRAKDWSEVLRIVADAEL